MPKAPRPLRSQPLWARVDENRIKLGVFVAFFVLGSAVLLDTAMVAVPGVLLSLLSDDFEGYFHTLGLVYGWSLLGLLAVGSILAAVQLSNAEDWVRARFKGRDLAPGEAPRLESAAHDIAIAAGMGEPPRLLVLESDAVNAFALGTTRSRPAIAVTQGLLVAMTEDEQRAVIAALTARIVAGDIMFGTALAALMGPLKAIRTSRKMFGKGAGCAADGCLGGSGSSGSSGGCAGDGCADGGGCLDSALSDDDSAGGCLGFIGMALFIAVVIAVTYAAVLTSAWIVTIWGRVLHRTTHEKADAEGMLLLKDPTPMLSALSKAISSSNEVGDPDSSYDGIFYAPTSGKPNIERSEKRRYQRLREVLGTEGIAAPDLP